MSGKALAAGIAADPKETEPAASALPLTNFSNGESSFRQRRRECLYLIEAGGHKPAPAAVPFSLSQGGNPVLITKPNPTARKSQGPTRPAFPVSAELGADLSRQIRADQEREERLRNEELAKLRELQRFD
jgi:hypothetical protein